MSLFGKSEIEVRTPFWHSIFFKETKCFFPDHSYRFNIVDSLRDREVACTASDSQGANFEFCIWRVVSSHSSHYPQQVLWAQFSLHVHKGDLNPHSFHFISIFETDLIFSAKPYYVCRPPTMHTKA